ncbi:hypothetical protein [Brachybacterium sp. UMB0905]|uniref:DUF7210 family protein n=1 Tax=Brachybacterium sp. UMB0905 TaxID=2069310 RepID=UPI000C805D1C|nr:hypothetical protein [Brachybacterium sp. UMB0905]PMC76408.1 hypothetical protein CJ197_04430 [Brachybacterium sp. UMB0905]
MADSKVNAVVSHNQEIDGKKYKAGDKVQLNAQLARLLAGRGSIKIQEKDAAKVAPAPAGKEASK